MAQYTTEGHSWALKFIFNKTEYTGSAQKMWNNGIPFFAVQWNPKANPGPPYSVSLYPHKGSFVTWACAMGTPQDIVDAVGKAIEERVDGAGFDIFAA